MLAKYEPLRYLLTFWNNRQKRKVSRTPSLQETASSVYSSEPSCSISASTSKQTWSRTRVVTAYRRRRLSPPDRRAAYRKRISGRDRISGIRLSAVRRTAKKRTLYGSGFYACTSDLLPAAVCGKRTLNGEERVYTERDAYARIGETARIGREKIASSTMPLVGQLIRQFLEKV